MDSKQSFLDKNLNAIKSRNGDVAEILAMKDMDLEIEKIPARDGQSGLKISLGKNQHYIHSKYTPIKEAQRWIQKITPDKENIVIFGLGLGYHLELIIAQALEYARIIVLIPEVNIIEYLLKVQDYTNIILDPRVHFVFHSDKINMKKSLDQLINWKKINSLEFVYIDCYQNIYGESLKRASECLRELMAGKIINQNTKFVHAEGWQRNFFNNLPTVYESTPLGYFRNKFRKIPAVIVSAGPSLNKNIHYLKGKEDRILILCTDTAFKVLQEQGITPHLLFTVDGRIRANNKFMNAEYSHVPLVYTPLSNDQVVGNHHGKKVVYTRGDYITHLFHEKGIQTVLTVGGSVATSAFSFACYVDADPVIFIGQDLSFTEERTHAIGTMHDKDPSQVLHKQKLNAANGYIKIKGNLETEVLTNETYRSFLFWFQDAIAVEQNNRTFINATEGGAFISGTQVSTLYDVLEHYCKEEYAIVNGIQAILEQEKPFSIPEIFALVQEHNEYNHELKKIYKKAQKACEYINEIIKKYERNQFHSSKIQELFARLDKIDDYIKKNKQSTLFIELMLQKNIVESDFQIYRMEKLNETEREKGLRVMNANLILYNGIIEAVEAVKMLMGDYFHKMELKIKSET